MLTFGLPFAVIALVFFTANRKIMGPLVNKPVTSFLACITTILILALNAYLLYSMAEKTEDEDGRRTMSEKGTVCLLICSFPSTGQNWPREFCRL